VQGPLQQWHWGIQSTPSTEPAGQDGGVYREASWPTEDVEEIENQTENSIDLLQQAGPATHIPGSSAVEASSNGFPCEECSRIFSKRYELNRHLRQHFPPFPCSRCTKAFQYSKDRTRHIRDIHKETVEESSLEYCRHDGYEYSTPRKDNLRRHIRARHPV